MQLELNKQLRELTTFKVPVVARFFSRFTNANDLAQLLEYHHVAETKKLILGGGSNILFTDDFDGTVLKNEITGINITDAGDHSLVRAGAGENWHNFVRHCISKNLGGIENLSLIPGNVGASPMQNIGAYGAEVKDVIHQVEGYFPEERRMLQFDATACRFGYRESIFKHELKDRVVITAVTFKLKKNPTTFNTSYGAIEEELSRLGKTPSLESISEAVINIRRSKLPDPAEIGNAGSFFKNPVVSSEEFATLQQKFPDAPHYSQADGSKKVPAGWLIEQCGWKGYRKGDAGVHQKQALVLVNYGNATGNDILQLSEEIIHSVKEKFNITLHKEVNII